jgi:2-keto-4-pentenoate hydratase/2-oxohepta-3-ene-1,7-dioic acid hydratase in catechol pathway
MAIVIGRRTARASRDDARAAIAGVTAVNASPRACCRRRTGSSRAQGLRHVLSARAVDRARARSRHLGVVARVNGTVRQDSRTSHLHAGPVDLVVFISNVMTLEPGDVISTGTPAGVARSPRGHRVDRDRGPGPAGQRRARAP